MNDPEESDSEWDSTLDFTSPRPMADKLSVPPEIEDEDASHQNSMVERPKPKERTTIPASQYKVCLLKRSVITFSCLVL